MRDGRISLNHGPCQRQSLFNDGSPLAIWIGWRRESEAPTHNGRAEWQFHFCGSAAVMRINRWKTNERPGQLIVSLRRVPPCVMQHGSEDIGV